MKIQVTIALTAIACFVTSVLAPATTAAEFHPLQGGIDTNIYIEVINVAEDGSVVTWTTAADQQVMQWKRASGTTTRLHENGWPVSMSGDGSVVSATTSTGPIKIVDGVVEPLPIPVGVGDVSARYVSPDGTAIFGYLYNTNQVVRWQDDDVSLLPPRMYINGVSSDGDILAGMSLDEGGPIRWSEQDGRQMLPEWSSQNEVFGMSSNGRWTVGRARKADRRHVALRWDGISSPKPLYASDAELGTSALDVTTDGSIVAGRLYLPDVPQEVQHLYAGLWTEETEMVRLQDVLVTDYGLGDELEGWILQGTYDITDDGRYMVGNALNPSGDPEAFYVDLGEWLPGDFNRNRILETHDIDDLSQAVREGTNVEAYDLNGDSIVDQTDRAQWVHDQKHTYFGDVNLDGEFNSADLVAIFEVGEYEDGVAGNSGWADGDWNGDGEFSTTDLVVAFQDGGYEQGRRVTAKAVPEPSFAASLSVILLVHCTLRRWSHKTG